MNSIHIFILLHFTKTNWIFFFLYLFLASGGGSPLYPEFLQYDTMIVQRPRIIVFFVATVSDLRRGSVVDKPCTYTSRCPSMPVADITDCPTMQSRWNMKYSYTVKCCNWQMKVWKLSFQEVFKSGCVRQKGRSGREREWIYRKKS